MTEIHPKVIGAAAGGGGGAGVGVALANIIIFYGNVPDKIQGDVQFLVSFTVGIVAAFLAGWLTPSNPLPIGEPK